MKYIKGKELVGKYVGNRPITKILNGARVIWENWREFTGNAFTRDNTTLSWSTGEYNVLNGRWATVIFDNGAVDTWSNFHVEYGYITFNDYTKIRVKEFTVTAHYNWKEGNFITTCSIEVSQDGSKYYTVASGVRSGVYQVNYDSFKIDYVRYVRYTMNIQNSSYGADGQTPTTHYTPSIVVSKYDKRGS